MLDALRSSCRTKESLQIEYRFHTSWSNIRVRSPAFYCHDKARDSESIVTDHMGHNGDAVAMSRRVGQPFPPHVSPLG